MLPSDSLSVSELLELCLPTFSSVLPSIEPELSFSEYSTESVAVFLSRPVPPVTFIEGLRDVARQAMRDNARLQAVNHGLDMQKLDLILLIRTH